MTDRNKQEKSAFSNLLPLIYKSHKRTEQQHQQAVVVDCFVLSVAVTIFCERRKLPAARRSLDLLKVSLASPFFFGELFSTPNATHTRTHCAPSTQSSKAIVEDTSTQAPTLVITWTSKVRSINGKGTQ